MPFQQEPQKHDAPGHFIDFLCRKEPVYAFQVKASRFDIGSIADYYEADNRLRAEPLFLS